MPRHHLLLYFVSDITPVVALGGGTEIRNLPNEAVAVTESLWPLAPTLFVAEV